MRSQGRQLHCCGLVLSALEPFLPGASSTATIANVMSCISVDVVILNSLLLQL